MQGREWERFAWLKSRVVAPRAAVTSGRALALRSLVTPFVYRRYLDYGVFEGLRTLHHKIREEAQRRAAGTAGARQRRQAVARRHPRDRVHRAAAAGGARRAVSRDPHALHAEGAGQAARHRADEGRDGRARLHEAYVFLRRIEHRIQFLDDQQTHLLPTNDDDLRWIAASVGLSCGKNACELLDRLGETREFVSTEFDTLLHDGRAPPPRNGGCRNGSCNGDPRRSSTARPGSTACRPSSPSACAASPRTRACRTCARRAGCASPSWCSARSTRSAPATARWTPPRASSTGSSRCCAARATWRCWWSARTCSGACCACWAWRAGRCAT